MCTTAADREYQSGGGAVKNASVCPQKGPILRSDPVGSRGQYYARRRKQALQGRKQGVFLIIVQISAVPARHHQRG